MKNKTVNAVAILGIISILSILSVQFVWIHNTRQLQQEYINIQQREDSLNLREFAQRQSVTDQQLPTQSITTSIPVTLLCRLLISHQVQIHSMKPFSLT